MHIAKKFEYLLDAYRRPDGRLWTGQEIDETTGGVVTRSYVTNLRKGRIQNPGFEKLRAIAQAIGFPPELWFEEHLDVETAARIEPVPGIEGIGEKVSHLFEVMRRESVDDPHTDAEVARASFGNLTEQDVKAIRTGQMSNPSMNQVVALADVFGVHPSYLLDRLKHTSLLDRETMDILSDETAIAIARKSFHLPEREKQLILNIIRQLEEM